MKNLEKNQIRKQYKNLRNQLTKDKIRKYSDCIMQTIRQTKEYQEANCILSYIDFGSEVITRDFITRAVTDGKNVFVPRVIGSEMRFFQFTTFDDLIKSAYGILEPTIEQLDFEDYCQRQQIASSKICMILPGLVFDLRGNRIGYGGGYYDRFLAAHKDIHKIAVCFDFQIIKDRNKALIADPFDQPFDFVVSESKLYQTLHKGDKTMDFTLMGNQATKAKYAMQVCTTQDKNEALLHVAKCLVKRQDEIIKENEIDLANGVANHMSDGLLDRLKLTSERIQAMAEGIEQVVALPDPIGEELSSFSRPNGLQIQKVRVPLGVIGIIYESRPNVTADAFALCFKSGNAVILKGGKDAIHSNIAIANIIRDALDEKGLDKNAIQLIENTDRAVTQEFMKCNEFVDVLIPRGSAGLIKTVVENSTIPVIETGSGNCHIYVDQKADLTKAIPIIFNAKTQRIGVCNACESLVVHEAILQVFLPALEAELAKKQVELRADEKAIKHLSNGVPATEADFSTEYLDYIMSIKTVSSVEEAIAHINAHNTKHSEAIITEDKACAETFLRGVDAACVYVNASTRFTDGFEFGFGAEIGISTQKLHARGPMGLPELTSYQYRILGDGQIRG